MGLEPRTHHIPRRRWAGPVSDLEERPAVPPRDAGADERYGWFVAGGLLIAVGLGVLVGLNLALHRIATSSGIPLGPFRIFPTIGAFSEASIALGIVAAIVGAALIGYARRSPPGPFVLPGEPY